MKKQAILNGISDVLVYLENLEHFMVIDLDDARALRLRHPHFLEHHVNTLASRLFPLQGLISTLRQAKKGTSKPDLLSILRDARGQCMRLWRLLDGDHRRGHELLAVDTRNDRYLLEKHQSDLLVNATEMKTAYKRLQELGE